MKISLNELIALSVLSKERISFIQDNIRYIQATIRTLLPKCNKDNTAGAIAYKQLNQMKNALRSSRTQYRSWSKAHCALKAQIREVRSQEVRTKNPENGGYRVWLARQNRWIENVSATEALVFKQDKHVVIRMDLPFDTPPMRDNRTFIEP